MEFEIKKGGHKDLYRISPMLQFDFRPCERVGQIYLQRALLTGAAELLLLKDETGCEAGYAVVYKKSRYGYVMIAYISIYHTMRRRGAGTRFMELIIEYYADRQGILINVSKHDAQAAENRQRFYAARGYKSIPCACRVGGVDSTLMYQRLKGPEITPPAAPLIIRDIMTQILPERKVDIFISAGSN